MSRGAHLGAIALHAALADAGWARNGGSTLDGRRPLHGGRRLGRRPRRARGDASRPAWSPATALASGGAHLDLVRFGAQGLAAANPMFAFQLMNNFTLCHGAIAAGLQGPSSAFHSRGAGTVTALREAAFAIAGGDVGRACAGGADSALHPVTLAELDRPARWHAAAAPARAPPCWCWRPNARARWHGCGGRRCVPALDARWPAGLDAAATLQAIPPAARWCWRPGADPAGRPWRRPARAGRARCWTCGSPAARRWPPPRRSPGPWRWTGWSAPVTTACGAQRRPGRRLGVVELQRPAGGA